MRFRAALMACLALGAAVSPALAQNEPPAAPSATAPAVQPAEPIAFLAVDQDRLFTESLWGKRAEADLDDDDDLGPRALLAAFADGGVGRGAMIGDDALSARLGGLGGVGHGVGV